MIRVNPARAAAEITSCWNRPALEDRPSIFREAVSNAASEKAKSDLDVRVGRETILS